MLVGALEGCKRLLGAIQISALKRCSDRIEVTQSGQLVVGLLGGVQIASLQRFVQLVHFGSPFAKVHLRGGWRVGRCCRHGLNACDS